MARHHWEGHTIDVSFHLLARLAWLGGGFVVRVDEGSTFQPPRGLEAKGTATAFEITHGGRVVPGVVKSEGRVRALGTSYEVIVDGAPLAKGRVRANNWYVLVLIATLVFALGGFLVFWLLY